MNNVGILTLILIVTIIYGILIYLTNNVENDHSTPVRYNNYKPPNSQERGKVIYPTQPPPRATFFSRENNEQNIINGKYEEKYLSTWDLRWWKLQKVRREAIEAGLVDEIPEDNK